MRNKAGLIFSIFVVIFFTWGTIVMIDNNDIIGVIFYALYGILAILNVIDEFKMLLK